MGWTKQQFVEQAYEERGMADYVFDLEPEELNTGLFKLDAMMQSWAGKGILLNYPIPDSPENSSLSTETNVPSWANEAIYSNLAMRLNGTGKQISSDTRKLANQSYKDLLSRFTRPREMQFPGTMPAGQGNRSCGYYDSAFLNDPVDRLEANPNSALNLS